jgi:hypothetical protein
MLISTQYFKIEYNDATGTTKAQDASSSQQTMYVVIAR